MKTCIFCKIIKKEIPSVKIWEDEKHFAILDINPNTKGTTLLLTKKHFDSDGFKIPEKNFKELMVASRKVSKIIEKKFKVKRVSLVMEGMGINHLHIKLYPLHGLTKNFKAMVPEKKVYFKKYPGYISTQLGPKKSIKELEKY